MFGFISRKEIDALRATINKQQELIDQLWLRVDKAEQDIDEKMETRIDAYLQNVEWDAAARDAIADIDMSDIAQAALEDVVRNAEINITF